MLNTDYKIPTKALANKFQKVIPKIVNTDQVRYIGGRHIGENNRIIEDLIKSSYNKKIQGLIALIDLQKAFDSIEWPFLFETMRFFNFGKKFISWIQLLYKGIKACTTINGY